MHVQWMGSVPYSAIFQLYYRFPSASVPFARSSRSRRVKTKLILWFVRARQVRSDGCPTLEEQWLKRYYLSDGRLLAVTEPGWHDGSSASWHGCPPRTVHPVVLKIHQIQFIIDLAICVLFHFFNVYKKLNKKLIPLICRPVSLLNCNNVCIFKDAA